MAKTVDEENTIFLTRVRFLKRTLVICFIFLLGWWMFLQFGGYGVGQHFLWGNFYQLIAILGLIGGFIISQYFFKWENKEIDLIGKSIQFFSIGLLFQIFGQNVYDFYVITLKNFIPYPSIADVGFFGSILFYISALITLARVKNVSLSFSSLNRKILIVLIPAILLSISYFFFLKEYHFNGNNPIKVFLDFAYPLGEVIYVSLAFLILFFGKNLDGTFKWVPLLLALIIQYMADFNFLFKANSGTWINGGLGDVLYMCAYFVLSLAILNLGSVFQKVTMEDLIKKYIK